MKKLYVFRGLPGSGKSTLAAKRAALVIEPDIFRYDADKKYVFDSADNDDVYMNTDDLLVAAMSLGVKCLAIAAVNATIDQVSHYVTMGLQYKYAVTVVECHGVYKNIHDVPPAVVAKMAREFEKLTPEMAAEWGVGFEIAGVDTPRERKSSRRWVVTYVDRGDTCDGKARIRGIYDSRDEAVSELVKDMDAYASKNPGASVNKADWSADLGDGAGCDWNVEGVPA